MSVYQLTQENFDENVLKAEKPVLVDFWASWCGPCKMLSPVVEQIANEHPEILVGKVNVDDEGALAVKYNVMSIPTLILFRNGKPAVTSVGYRPKNELEELLK